jgi:hypothetical protein
MEEVMCAGSFSDVIVFCPLVAFLILVFARFFQSFSKVNCSVCVILVIVSTPQLFSNCPVWLGSLFQSPYISIGS